MKLYRFDFQNRNMPTATNLRHHMVGLDATIPGIGGCPFNMDKLQESYVEGMGTPNRIIKFTSLDTGINMSVEKFESSGCEIDGNNILDVVACSGFFESHTLNFGVSNLQKLGAAKSSDVWVAIPQNIVVPQLVQMLHCGALKTIAIAQLAYIAQNTPENKPTVIQLLDFEDCFIKFIDPISYGRLAVFAFSFGKLVITQIDINPNAENNNGNQQTTTGRRVYEINYNDALGKIS